MFGVVALIVSLLIANIAAAAYSSEVKGVLTPFVGGIVDTALVELVEEDLVFEIPLEDEVDSIDYPTAFSALRLIGLPEAAAVRVAEMAVSEEEEEPGAFLTDLISNQLSSALAYVAVFGIAFLLLAIIFAVVGNLIGFVFSLPGLKLVDIIAGAALGTIKGFIIIYAIAVIVRYFGLLAIETFEQTSILSHIANNNPIANMLGI